MAFTKRNKAAVKALVSCHETGKPVANYSAIVVLKDDAGITYKSCNKCGESKPLSAEYFFKRTTSKDGFRSECKSCKSQQNKKYHQSHKVERKIRDSQNRELLNAKAREYRQENLEKSRNYERNRDRAEHYEKRKIFYRTTEGRERRRLWNINRRCRERSGGKILKSEWNKLKEQYDYKCLSCLTHESVKKLTIDHIVAISKGGSNTIDNIQPLCLPCNMAKGVKTIDYRSVYNGIHKT